MRFYARQAFNIFYREAVQCSGYRIKQK
jgi:hypothetical protein